MTHPQQGRGAPPFEQLAQDTIASALRETPAYYSPHYMGGVVEQAPLTDEEKAAAAEIEKQKLWCRLCACVHPLPNTAACPRLASFELDGEGKVKAGTFWKGDGWMRGRALPIEDLHEEASDAGQ